MSGQGNAQHDLHGNMPKQQQWAIVSMKSTDAQHCLAAYLNCDVLKYSLVCAWRKKALVSGPGMS
jgi:hypothetical protein